ncbi:hypothetical protein [Flavobacterium sp. 3HN19-14]|uniref:hypothetical protein n=1 Tax=Flavobacterium sp. 3HN19-14 TaxID=3448133 RepID=UPI003EDF6E9C
MKGKNIFTKSEITEIEKLIVLRNKTAPSDQKAIRQKMRNLGFYGRDDYGITDLQINDLNSLIKSGRIKISDNFFPVANPKKNVKKNLYFEIKRFK